jgi:hypothetical protein
VLTKANVRLFVRHNGRKWVVVQTAGLVASRASVVYIELKPLDWTGTKLRARHPEHGIR